MSRTPPALLFALATAVPVILSAPTHAAKADATLAPADLAAPSLETVIVTATRARQQSGDLAGSVVSIEREALAMIAPVHITEALARSPGTWISRGNGQEHLTAIRSPVFTGPGSCGSFYMAEDGVPIRPAGFCNVNQLFEVDAAQAERVEVLRGPGTAVHGGTALHGVINVISRAPAGSAGGELALEGGPHDYARLRGAVEGGQPGNAWRLHATAAHDGGYKDDSGYEDYKLGWRHDLDGDGWQFKSLLSATKLQQETAGYTQGERSYRHGRERRENPNPEAFRDNTALRWQGSLTLPYAAGRHWVITPFVRHQTMEFRQHFLPGVPLEENGATSAGWQAAHHWQGNGSWGGVAGVDGEWARGTLEQYQPEAVPGNPILPQGWQYDYTVRGLNGAAFARVSWQALPALQLDGGARIEHQRYDYDNDLPAGAVAADGSPCLRNGVAVACRYARPADRNDRFTDTALDLGAVWELGAGQSLHARLARGFRPPQAAELYRLQEGQEVADLDSERVDSIELGWRGSEGPFSHELTAYFMDKRDVIFQDTQRRNVTGADSEHYGVEYLLHWQFAKQWHVATSGSWSRHRYTANAELSGTPASVNIDGNDMVAAPRTLASTRLGWDSDGFGSWELEWLHIGSYYLEPTSTAKYSGHDLLNLRWRQQFTPRFHIAARLLNVTDRAYAERADYAFGNYRYFVGEPRSLYVEAGWRF